MVPTTGQTSEGYSEEDASETKKLITGESRCLLASIVTLDSLTVIFWLVAVWIPDESVNRTLLGLSVPTFSLANILACILPCTAPGDVHAKFQGWVLGICVVHVSTYIIYLIAVFINNMEDEDNTSAGVATVVMMIIVAIGVLASLTLSCLFFHCMETAAPTANKTNEK
uniref:Transmembrane protein n=1 Tax=Odontella aurita TaxID=265563 RepID=A0A7S4NJB8_9STRA